MKLTAVPAFTDNYIWMLHDGRHAAVVDPGDAAPVERVLDREALELRAILVTHHHPDHVGGIARLRGRLRGEVVGPARERIEGLTVTLAEGDRIDVLGTPFRVLDVPGHTAGHIAYLQDDRSSAPLLFCGDTLFSAGCGRLFEGTPAQMYASLDKLAALPEATRVCCTHEYTVSNLRFATAVEPGNEDVAAYLRDCEALRAKDLPTLPSSIGLERRINPFLRCDVPEVVAAAAGRGAPTPSREAVFASLREWKNVFR